MTLREIIHEAWQAGYYAACDYHRLPDDTIYPSEINRWIENQGLELNLDVEACG